MSHEILNFRENNLHIKLMILKEPLPEKNKNKTQPNIFKEYETSYKSNQRINLYNI